MKEGFVVSARKYRPSRFDEMLGQDSVCHTLKNSIVQNKIAHAYLFCGPRGVGKTSAARIFAKTINCSNRTSNGEACGTCENCQAVQEQRSLNLLELDAASNNSADDIRSINKDAYILPQGAKYKVYIIDEVHMLSSSAFNAFLKTLEEPPEYVVFIMATTEKNKVLPTVLSRCQVYDFKPIEPTVIVDQLTQVADAESVNYEKRSLELIARMADGGMRDALSIFDRVVSSTDAQVTYDRALQCLNILDDEYYFSMTHHLASANYQAALLLLDELFNMGVSGKTVINDLAEFMRNLLLARSPKTLPLFKYAGSEADRFADMAQKVSPHFLYKAIDLLVACDRNYRLSHSKRLLIELTLLQIAELSGGFPAEAHPNVSNNTPLTNNAVPPTTGNVNHSTAQASVQPPKNSTAAPQPKPQSTAYNSASTQAKTTPRTNVSQPTSTYNGEVKKKLDNPSPTPTNQTPKKVISISSITNKKDNNKTLNNQKRATDYNEDQFLQCWYDYITRHASNKVMLKNIMEMAIPKHTEEHRYELRLVNDFQKNEIEEILPHIYQFLRDRLSNDLITFDLIIDPESGGNLPFTNEDRLAALAEINPNFTHFVESLGLTPQ